MFKMEINNQTIINSAVGIVMILIAGYLAVGDTSLEPNYYCEEREIKAFCYSLSSTMKTCYTEMNKTGGKRCSEWKEIGNLEEINITPIGPYGDEWLCPPKTEANECIKLN